jgi:outer membrane receptor protein involved in Fe transport
MCRPGTQGEIHVLKKLIVGGHEPAIEFAVRTMFAAVIAAFGMPQAYAQETSKVVAAAAMPEVSVTGTREKELLSETPASIGVIREEAIRQVRPTHPSQIISQVPGAAVSITNGEGHQTAIRQPFTTGPVYLFLEAGVPIRATGFFNHNALYEINIPGAGGIEVIRGPGTALYGSDAIGGVINVLTPTPPTRPEGTVTGEVGSNGWHRLLLGGGNGSAENAWRADANITHIDGWRDKTAYDRQSLGFRWDHAIDGGQTLKTVVSLSRIDQETGANSIGVHPIGTDSVLPIVHRVLSQKKECGCLGQTVRAEFRSRIDRLFGDIEKQASPRALKPHDFDRGLCHGLMGEEI